MPTIAQTIRGRFCHLAVALLLLAAAGAVTDAAASGRICIDNDTFMFGNRAVGSSTTAVATVSNCGDAAWSFTDVSVHPATGPAFHVNAMCATGLTLAPGATCTVSVNFAPTTTGQTSGGVWLRNTTTAPDPLITFYGRGVDEQSGTASLVFVPASADFASQAVGTASMPLEVELRNLGPAALTLRAVVLNGPEVYDFFFFNETCRVGAVIAPGDSCHLSLNFRPQAAGTRRANLVIDSPQLASLAIMQISGAAQAGALPNYTGLFWNAPDGSEPGWGINFAHQGDVIFATWFTYDRTGKAWWLSVTANKAAEGVYSGTLVRTSGAPFGAYVPPATATPVGTATMTFTSADAGTFSYSVNDGMNISAQTKAITRQIFGPVPTCVWGAQQDLTQATNFQDLWWAAPAASEAGWGVNVTQQGPTIFATWFTYDADRNPLWLSVTATQTGANTFSGALDRTTGPAFGAVPFGPVQHNPVGTATFTFTDGNTGTFAYNVDLGDVANKANQIKAITRQVFRPPGTACR
ncbi:MAG: choice-of-anchor D domain-containing protein [Betaproteobacteria bacterium]